MVYDSPNPRETPRISISNEKQLRIPWFRIPTSHWQEAMSIAYQPSPNRYTGTKIKRDVQTSNKNKKNKPRYFNSAQAMQTCIVSASRSLKKCDIHPAQEKNNPSENKQIQRSKKSSNKSQRRWVGPKKICFASNPSPWKERKISTPVPRDMHVEKKSKSPHILYIIGGPTERHIGQRK